MSKKVYVVEYANENWGQSDLWLELGWFDSLDEAKEKAMEQCLLGDAVRMYTKEIPNE